MFKRNNRFLRDVAWFGGFLSKLFLKHKTGAKTKRLMKLNGAITRNEHLFLRFGLDYTQSIERKLSAVSFLFH